MNTRKARGATVSLSIKDVADPHALAALQRVTRVAENICPKGGPVTVGALVLDEDQPCETGAQGGNYSKLASQV